jgi:hypothetical protein
MALRQEIATKKDVIDAQLGQEQGVSRRNSNCASEHQVKSLAAM